jgi:hypothetical protein
MIDTASRRTKEPVSDLSQVLAYGPAYRESYGKFLGALLMLYAITKTRRGAVGVATAVSVVGTFFYNMFWK